MAAAGLCTHHSTFAAQWRAARRASMTVPNSASASASALGRSAMTTHVGCEEMPDSPMLALVINLKRREDRMRRLHALRLPFAWDRLDAVDGRTLSWSSLREFVHEKAIGEAVWAESESVPTICRRTNSFSPHLTLAAAGCALSHRNAWRALVDSPPHREYALIMEDDLCEVCASFERQLALVLAQLPAKWHVVFLGYHESSGRVLAPQERPQIIELPPGPAVTGLFGYLLHRRGASALLIPGAVFPLRHQVDVAVSQHTWPAKSRFVVSPQAVLVASPKSEEGACDTDVQTLGPPSKRAHANLPKTMLVL